MCFEYILLKREVALSRQMERCMRERLEERVRSETLFSRDVLRSLDSLLGEIRSSLFLSPPRKETTLSSSVSSPEDQVSISRLYREIDLLHTDLDCCVCLSSPKNTVFLPCRHMKCCSSCSRTLTVCPVCRGDIASVVLVYP
jgi:hypothetical protein